MIIVIDGYNILKYNAGQLYVSEERRRHFVRRCARYGHFKNNSIVIVFDGGDSQWQSSYKDHDALVIYAGHGKSADDAIKRYMSKQRADNLLLISSDNELAYWASERHIASMGAPDFLQILSTYSIKQADHSTSASIIKTTQDSSPELDALMQEAALMNVSKPEDNPTIRDKNADKLSKSERQLYKKLKKL